MPERKLNHIVEGGAGDDRMDNNDHSDGSNDDYILTGAGRDTVSAGAGNDTICGGSGAGYLDGGIGDDVIFGFGGDDTLFGYDGDDELFGGLGDDSLSGGAGFDRMFGEAGDDLFHVGEGDKALGGDGDDLFLVGIPGEEGRHQSTVIGGEGGETLGDTLDFRGQTHWRDVTYTNPDPGAGPGAGGRLSGQATLSDGSVLKFSEIETVIICFTAGTRIATEHGLRRVEDLGVGARLVTRDHGLQPVRWAGARSVPAQGALAPIRFEAGVLGNARPLSVSPQHRMLIEGAEAMMLFGQDEVLASAKHLVNGGSVAAVPGGMVRYVHLLFDDHEIIYAEGAPSESFFPGEAGLRAVDAPAREELFGLFPELRDPVGRYGATARMCLRRHEAGLVRL